MKRRTVATIAAIPVAFALAMGATSQRLVDRWWPTFPNDRVDNAADGSATLTGVINDPRGSHPYAVRLSLASAAPVTEVVEAPGAQPQDGVTVPEGLRLWRLTFDVTVPVTTVVGGCTFDVRDDQGRHYSPGTELLDGFSSTTSSCLPPDGSGPRPATSVNDTSDTGGEGAKPRPPAYQRFVHVVMPDDVRPSSVQVWIETPHYAEFEITRD